MKVQVHYVLVSILFLCGNVSLSQQEPEDIAISGTVVTNTSNEWTQKLGKARSEESQGPLITGVDAIGAMAFLLPEYRYDPNGTPLLVSRHGVRYRLHTKGLKDNGNAASIALTVGVHETRDKAIVALGQTIRMISGGVVGLSDLGDRAFIDPGPAMSGYSNIVFRRRNVVVSLGIGLSHNDAQKIARQFDDILQQDERWVTWGEEVELPQFSIPSLPDRVGLGQTVEYPMVFPNSEPDQMIIGVATPQTALPLGVVIARRTTIPSIHFRTPKEAGARRSVASLPDGRQIIEEHRLDGPKTFTILVANRKNVVTAKTFTVNIVPGENRR